MYILKYILVCYTGYEEDEISIFGQFKSLKCLIRTLVQQRSMSERDFVECAYLWKVHFPWKTYLISFCSLFWGYIAK